MSAAKRAGPRDPVADAAREAMDRSGGDVAKAAKILEGVVRSKPSLRDALTDPLIAGACYDAVRAQVRMERKSIWNPPNLATGSAASKSAVLAQTSRVIHLATGTLLMFPLPGGKRLGEATRSEISEAANFYERQGKDMNDKARWLRLVAQSIAGKKKAGEVLTDKRLRELQSEARRARK